MTYIKRQLLPIKAIQVPSHIDKKGPKVRNAANENSNRLLKAQGIKD